MSLFDRYDQNEAQMFLRDTCFQSTSQHRFDDLFEQIHQHFQRMNVLSTSEDSLRMKETMRKSTEKSHELVGLM
jgi:hypothetical protein